MSKERLVIVGGDAAGMSAATNARRRRSPEDLEIIVFDKGAFVSYAACGIPYFIGRAVDQVEKLLARRPEEFARVGIQVYTRHQVEAIDLSSRTVLVQPLEGGKAFREPFDHLLIATGAVPIRPPLPGMDAKGVFGVNNLEDALALDRYLEETGAQRAVIVGGGYIGLEMAEALCQRSLQVSLVEKEPQVMLTLDPDMAEPIAQALREIGVALYLGEALQGIEAANGRVRAVVTEARTIPADVVVLGMGVRPNTALAQEAGIPLGEKGSIVVNERMKSPIEGVWAAGDCAQSFHLVSRRPFWVALGTVANKHGRVAGINIAGGYATFPGVVGTAITKVCHLEVARTGLQERELRALGWEWVSARVEDHTRARYYPGSAPITVKLLAERDTGRILGGQIVGGEGSGKRIDVIATALHACLTAHEMANLDLAYAPPFAPVWDPLLNAARQLLRKL